MLGGAPLESWELQCPSADDEVQTFRSQVKNKLKENILYAILSPYSQARINKGKC
jgi:hypothetical protein